MKTIFPIIFILNSCISIAQCDYLRCGGASDGPTLSSPCVNHEKYWYYRERLKNFASIGDCQGCSLPVEGRSPTGQPHDLDWSDVLDHDTHYIGMLAMEYKLLSNHTTSLNLEQLPRTVEELFYAIEAINRLDKMAEYWWEYYYNNNHSYTSSTTNGISDDLNGFLIRDDIPADFGNQLNHGDLVENELNSSLVPLPDGFTAKSFDSGFIEGIAQVGSGFGGKCSQFNTKNAGPETASKEHIIALMVGLSLVTKYCNGVTFPRHTFSDNETDFHQEAKNIAARVTNWLEKHGWQYKNPVTGECGTGVEWSNKHHVFDDCKCGAGGSDVAEQSWGFAWANSYIQSDFDKDNANDYFDDNYSSVNKDGNPAWLFKDNCHDFDFYNLALATIGNVWGDDNTPAVLYGDRARHRSDLHHYCLLYEALHGKGYHFNDGFFECLLNSAPCEGTTQHTGMNEWSGGDRVADTHVAGGYSSYNRCTEVGNPNGLTTFSGMTFGVDYMFYFNLYNLVVPTYFGSGYEYIRPEDLLQNDIIKKDINNSDYTESDHKNFYACNSVTAQASVGKHYIIENDNDPQSQPYKNARVNFVAGNYVDLKPGFNAMPGTFFEAKIDHTLKPIQCTNASGTSSCSYDYFFNDILHGYVGHRMAHQDSITKKNPQLNVSIMPNPNNGLFTLTLITQNETGTSEIFIYNDMGKLIHNQSLRSSAQQMDLSLLPKGIYFVKVQTADKVYTEKVVVQ